MITPISLIFLPLFSSSLRLGYLTTSSQDERAVLQKCLPKRRFELVTLPACQNFSGIENGAMMFYTHGVDVIVADECDDEFDTLSKLAHRWQKLFVTFGHTALPADDHFTTVIFAPSNPLGVASAVAALCEHANWDQIGFYVDPAVDVDKDRIFRTFEQMDRNLSISLSVNGQESDWTEQVAQKTRVLFIIGLPVNIHRIFTDFYSKTTSPADFNIIFVDIYRIPSSHFYLEVGNVLQEQNIKARTIRNILLLSSVHFDKQTVRDFAFSNRLKVQPSLENHLLLCDLFSLLFSVNSTTEKSPWDQHVQTIQRTGLSGPILVSDGVRYTYMKLYGHMNGKPEEISQVYPYERNGKGYHTVQRTNDLYRVMSILPEALPECGFMGEKCSVGHIFLIAGVVLTIISIPLGIAFYLQRKEDELIRMPWRIGYDQLTYKAEIENPGYRRISSYSESNNSQDDIEASKRFAYVGNVKVTAHHFHQKRAVTFTRSEMERLNQLKNINHSNVNPFIGMTFNQNSELVVLWNYCVRGSLDDVCFGTGKRLGRNFQSTFLKHILHGLKYIHSSPIKVHGSLFLTNCVVDSYWVVRLTDFGLNSVLKSKIDGKELVANAPINIEYMNKKFLQLPPEHLHILKETKDFYAVKGTVEGDIYQFGMVMYQILFYRRPFRERRESNEAIMGMICDSERKVAMRPLVGENNEFSMRLLSVMQQCWLQKADNRPVLFKITDAVAREFGHSAKGTLIDQMITMIDEYSANLEEIVAERTKLLEEQHERTEALLYRLLPRQIANSLRDGLPIRPQLHVAVSLLVSDLCRFTALCESCIPEHIIDILQTLYSSFDLIISRFQCFKIENVGDAYLLVSGIPEMANYTHLAEVCRIAIEIQTFVRNFVVPHKNEFKMQVKMGVSCGAVASGILGSLSPRFCIFGDTVNTACRMASTALPAKVQMTEQSQNLLATKFPNFIAEERGIVDVKGKGPSMTYWLVGETPVLRPPKTTDEVFLDVVDAMMPKSGRSIRSWRNSAKNLKL